MIKNSQPVTPFNLKPRAHSTNQLAASVTEYAPQPGRQVARHMRLEVQNTPGHQVDEVIDAFQRYFDISPRREPTADPRDEDSIARHPQQIIQSAQRWAADQSYQFSDNGVEFRQFQPEYRAWAGRLELTMHNPGPADISAPPTVVGPPLMSESQNPATAWQTATAQTTANLTPDPPTRILVGPVNWIDDVQTNPDQAWRTAVVVDEGLAAGHQGLPGGGLVKDFRPRGFDQAYIRAIRIIDELEIGALKPQPALNGLA
ncbi:MAG: hypothetical protein LBP55_09130 [Candidatus Adiutrix sp.]|jgi:hypothetical protein|nr:hypothetical protein [Candidatus Adiutrix sp.]